MQDDKSQPNQPAGTHSLPPTQPDVTPATTPQHSTASIHALPAAPATHDQNFAQPVKQKSGIFSFFVTIVLALVIVQLINLFLFQSYRVVGSSMFPTLHEGDLLVISKLGKTTASLKKDSYQPERGDIVVFQSPKGSLRLIKRVIGLPGERVVVKNGQLTIFNQQHPNGFNPDKGTSYEKNLPETSGNVDVVVPKNHLFVSGDNRSGSNSLDSRNELGTVSEDLLAGKLSLRLWPISSARFF